VIGETLAQYRILEEIGAGGMGVVYLARDTRLERPVALKFVRAGDDPHRPRSSLLREARAASALNHPNVCTIHEVGESDAAAYIVMEHVEGETLAARIARTTLSPEAAIAIGLQIASALVHAHGRGVIHRDLKSANIMIGAEDRIKVLDFGLSRRITTGDDDRTRQTETVTEAGGLTGTLAYLSPEILRGAEADEHADLWALGVVLHEMCASRRPFEGATPYEMSAAILGMEPPALPSRIPAPLRALVTRALAKDRDARFESAVELREALEAMARGEGGGATRRRFRTLVVLPFDNLSGDESQDFFADGMTEAITAAVARLGTIRVISRTSAMQFKADRPPLPEIARRLDADVAVEGSVLRAGNRVRITAQLIDARTDEHLWADTEDRALENVLDLQDDVARAIADGIRSRIGAAAPDRPEPVAPAPRTRRVDPEAYVEYLRGRHAWTARTPEALRRAIAHYQRAIELDPTYARPHAGIAECYGVLGFMGVAAPRNTFVPAQAAARRALELDPSEGAARIALGYLATHYRWELDLASAAFEEGLRLEPDDMNGRHWYALLLTSRGRRDAAVEQLRLAAELDPLSLIVRVATGLVLYFFGEFEAAAAECRDALDMSPDYLAARWTLAKALLGQGDVAQALELLQPMVEEQGWAPAAGDHGRALALAGHPEKARKVLERLESDARRTYVPPLQHAIVQVGLGERGAALDWLEKAFEEGGNWLNYLHLEPAFADLREEAGFASLVRRVAGIAA